MRTSSGKKSSVEHTSKLFSNDLAFSGTARGWRILCDGFDSRLGPIAFDMCAPGAAHLSTSSSLRSSLQNKKRKMRKRVDHEFFVMKASCTCPITVMLTCWGSTSEVLTIDSQIKAETLKQCRIAVNCTKNKTGKLFKFMSSLCLFFFQYNCFLRIE